VGLEALYLLIPASIVLAVIALALFIWAIHSGQFDDLETPAIRILFEDGSEAAPPRLDLQDGSSAAGSVSRPVPHDPHLKR
jgi:cbb3-type cytochrome oxidase maturation protein